VVLCVLLIWVARATLEDNVVMLLLCALLIWLFRIERGLTPRMVHVL
jgi:hypothetical protein